MLDRKLRVFLCHSSQDKPIVCELYQQLLAEGWIDPWLDEEKLLPGQDFDLEIKKAVGATDAVVICLSNKSVKKEGYVQKEINAILDKALEKPEGTIFIIPLRLNKCELPSRLEKFHRIDYYPKKRADLIYESLLNSLKQRAKKLKISIKRRRKQISENIKDSKQEEKKEIKKIYSPYDLGSMAKVRYS